MNYPTQTTDRQLLLEILERIKNIESVVCMSEATKNAIRAQMGTSL